MKVACQDSDAMEDQNMSYVALLWQTVCDLFPRVHSEASRYPWITKPAVLPGKGTGRRNSHPDFIFASSLPLGQALAVNCLHSTGCPRQDRSWVPWRKQPPQTFITDAVVRVSDDAVWLAAHWQMAPDGIWHTFNLPRKSSSSYSPHGTRYNFHSWCSTHYKDYLSHTSYALTPMLSQRNLILHLSHWPPVLKETLTVTYCHPPKAAISPCQFGEV